MSVHCSLPCVTLTVCTEQTIVKVRQIRIINETLEGHVHCYNDSVRNLRHEPRFHRSVPSLQTYPTSRSGDFYTCFLFGRSYVEIGDRGGAVG